MEPPGKLKPQKNLPKPEPKLLGQAACQVLSGVSLKLLRGAPGHFAGQLADRCQHAIEPERYLGAVWLELQCTLPAPARSARFISSATIRSVASSVVSHTSTMMACASNSPVLEAVPLSVSD